MPNAFADLMPVTTAREQNAFAELIPERSENAFASLIPAQPQGARPKTISEIPAGLPTPVSKLGTPPVGVSPLTAFAEGFGGRAAPSGAVEQEPAPVSRWAFRQGSAFGELGVRSPAEGIKAFFTGKPTPEPRPLREVAGEPLIPLPTLADEDMPKGTFKRALFEGVNAINRGTSNLTTPQNAALLVALPFVPIEVKPLIDAYFVGRMGPQAYAQAQQGMELLHKGDVPKAVGAFAGAGFDAAFTGLMIKGAVDATREFTPTEPRIDVVSSEAIPPERAKLPGTEPETEEQPTSPPGGRAPSATGEPASPNLAVRARPATTTTPEAAHPIDAPLEEIKAGLDKLASAVKGVVPPSVKAVTEAAPVTEKPTDEEEIARKEALLKEIRGLPPVKKTEAMAVANRAQAISQLEDELATLRKRVKRPVAGSEPPEAISAQPTAEVTPAPQSVAARPTGEAGQEITPKVTEGLPAHTVPGAPREGTRPTTTRRSFALRADLPPVFEAIIQNGGLKSKSAWREEQPADAKAVAGGRPVPPEYDGAQDAIAHPTHNIIYGNGRGGAGTMPPDVMAQTLYDQGALKEPTVDALWDAIRGASQGWVKQRAGEKAMVQTEKQQVKQDKAFSTAIGEKWPKESSQQSALSDQPAPPGKVAVHVDELADGATVNIDGTPMRVKVDPDTLDVTLEDGKRFGIQRLEKGSVIWAEREAASSQPSAVSGQPAPKPAATRTIDIMARQWKTAQKGAAYVQPEEETVQGATAGGVAERRAPAKAGSGAPTRDVGAKSPGDFVPAAGRAGGGGAGGGTGDEGVLTRTEVRSQKPEARSRPGSTGKMPVPRGDRKPENGKALNPNVPFWQAHSVSEERAAVEKRDIEAELKGKQPSGPDDLVDMVRPFNTHGYEVLRLVVLDDAGRIVAYKHYEGGVNSVQVNYADALWFLAKARDERGGDSFVMTHNHPSGDASPSKEDFAFTKSLARSGDTLGVPLTHHLVAADEGWMSITPTGDIGDAAVERPARERVTAKTPEAIAEFARGLPAGNIGVVWLNTKNGVVGYSTAPAEAVSDQSSAVSQRFGDEAAEVGAVMGVVVHRGEVDLPVAKWLGVEASKRQVYVSGDGFKPADVITLEPGGGFHSAYGAGEMLGMAQRMSHAGVPRMVGEEPPTPGVGVSADALKAAGFESEEVARREYGERGIKDVGESFAEFLQRVHCQGLKGRNAFSIRSRA